MREMHTLIDDDITRMLIRSALTELGHAVQRGPGSHPPAPNP